MLLLYMSSNQNIGLFDKSCADNSIVIKQLNGDFNLSQFVIQDMSNMNCYQYLAIDLSCLKDTDDEIINTIVGIKSMYDIRIIIFTLGYEGNNPLLGRLFAEGIYNIITAIKTKQQQEEILNCLSDDGMQYKDSIKYRMQNTHSSKSSRIIIQKQSIKQTISVGVCGALHRMCTTSQALHIAKYLNENDYKACYIEDNGHGHMETLEDFYNVKTNDNGSITYDELDIFPEFDVTSILKGGYDFLVYDNGLFEEIDKQQFLTKDIKIVCVGSKSWEASCIMSIFQSIKDYTDIHFIFSFTPENMKKEVRKLMDKYKNNSYFAEYAPELIDGFTNREIYKQIFREYIHDKDETIHRNGLLRRLKR